MSTATSGTASRSRHPATTQPTGERPGKAIEEGIDGNGERNRRAIPAEGDFERVDEHGGHGGDPGREYDGETGHSEDDPGIVQPGRAVMVHPLDSFLTPGGCVMIVDRSINSVVKKSTHAPAGRPCRTPSNMHVRKRRSGAGLLLTLARRSAPSKLSR